MAVTEKRRDTVAIPRQAFTFIAALATALIIAVAGVLWNVTTESIRVDERVTHLEVEAAKGDRFTAAQGAVLRKEIRELQAWRQAHSDWGREKTGTWDQLHREAQRRLNAIERKLHDK